MGLKNFYQCKSALIPGHNYATVYKVARKVFNRLKSKTKRRAYIRSTYFKGEKIFFDNFWVHLNQKGPVERYKRLKFFDCAIELIQKSAHKPINKIEDRNFTLYRFMGKCEEKTFIVQIKEDIRRKQKFIMSVFEYNKK